jgi:two-component system CheB/CheR fusion protein
VLDRKLKLYQRKEDLLGAQRTGLGRFLPSMTTPHSVPPRFDQNTASPRKLPLREVTEQALLQQLVQAGALVNAQGDILYLHGRTGMYLEPAPGESGPNNIIKMAREGLRRDLTSALHKAAVAGETVHCPGLRVKTNGDITTVNLIVRPVTVAPLASPDPPLYLVVLEQAQVQSQKSEVKSQRTDDGRRKSEAGNAVDAEARIAALKQELRAKEEYLQATNEELETSNEELKSANEEMQSINEELQSTNEELETSKEELQSVNEELSTVNNELQTKVADLSRANNDMNNLLAGTGIATVFVDLQLRILRFTPAATRIINLIQSDIGRPVGHIVSNLLGYECLMKDTQAVLDTLIPKELDVRSAEGRWYTMRILPYRTMDNVIEGAVLTFVDVTKARAIHEELRVNEERLRFALNTASISVFNQDANLRYTWIHNPDPGFQAKEVIGKTDADLLPKHEAAALTAIKQQVLESGKSARQAVQTTIAGKTLVYDLTVEPLQDSAGVIVGITGASQDLTETKDRERTDGAANVTLPSKNSGDNP